MNTPTSTERDEIAGHAELVTKPKPDTGAQVPKSACAEPGKPFISTAVFEVIYNSVARQANLARGTINGGGA